MEALSCKELGERSCPFFAKGESSNEVAGKMLSHLRECHPEKFEDWTDQELKRILAQKTRVIWTAEDFGIS